MQPSHVIVTGRKSFNKKIHFGQSTVVFLFRPQQNINYTMGRSKNYIRFRNQAHLIIHSLITAQADDVKLHSDVGHPPVSVSFGEPRILTSSQIH